MSRLTRLISAVFGAEWAMHPPKLLAMVEVLEFQAEGGKLTAQEIAARIGTRRDPQPSGGGIGILPLYGILAHRASQVQDTSGPGGTSTEQFGAHFDAMLADPAISAIVLDIDSPGGTVAGTPELARKIYEARGKKPIYAHVNSMAASAAYWIACACDAIWVTESGDVGNIGVYALHTDLSAAEAADGIKTTVISAGKYKAEGNPHEPLSEEAHGAMQERVQGFYRDFAQFVATGRGVKLDAVLNGFGEGRIVRAKEAVAMGMADQVGTMDQLLATLGATGGSRGKVAATAPTLRLVAAEHPATTSLALSGVDTHSSAADVAAAPVVVPLHVEPAPVAKESGMSDKDTPVLTGAEQAAAQRAEEARLDGLLAIASEHSIPMATVQKWRKAGTSVTAAQAEVLAELKLRLEAAPTLTPIRGRVTGGSENGAHGPYPKGLTGLGQNLKDIVAAQTGRGVSAHLHAVQELAAVTSGGASATVGTDGGFLIQKDFSADLLESSFKAGDILSRVDTTEVGPQSDGLEVVYLDETDRATGSRWGGVQVYRGAEADSATAKKPKVGKWESRLEDIIGVAYMTERLLQDAPAMADVFSKGFTEEFTFVSENEIFRGSGTLEILGILTALYSSTAGSSLGPTVTVAKETGQAADTIVAENIQKMWTRVHPRSRLKGAWFINVECEPQLDNMMIGTGTSGQLVYMPPGGLSGASYGTLKGRPVIPCEYSAGLGDVGDIVFADFSRFKVITKGGLQSDESIHVRFLNNERTFRWLTRINGAPKDKSAIKPFKATDTTLRLSPFVGLAAR